MTAPAAAASRRPAGVVGPTQDTVYAAPVRRELASRGSDGVHVLLLWCPNDDVLTVSVDDFRSGHGFDFVVERDRALDAFYHPFANAATRSLVRHSGERQPLDLRRQV